MQRYDLLKRLGDGTYGSVWMGKHKKSGEVVAIKTLKRKFTTWEECVTLRELESLRNLPKNSNIVQIKELIREDDSQLHFVFEYMADGNLYQLMKKCIERRSNSIQSQNQQVSSFDLTPDTIRSIVLQVLRGLAHIHALGFIHRDIKPENLLLQGNTCKIADFGLARKPRMKPNSPALTEYISTRWYRAPEVLLKSPKYSAPIDIFAVGCVMAEMIELKPLFPGSSELDQIHKLFTLLGQPTFLNWPEGVKLLDRIKFPTKNDSSLPFNYDYRFDTGEIINSPLDQSKVNLANVVPSTNQITLSFLHKLLMMNPDDRPTARECISDPFFISEQNIDQIKVQKRTGFETEYETWANVGPKPSGLSTSTPYLEAEAIRKEKRNQTRIVQCGSLGQYSMTAPMNLLINSYSIPKITDLDYQHCDKNGRSCYGKFINL